jgi:D-lactate dehydrogenase
VNIAVFSAHAFERPHLEAATSGSHVFRFLDVRCTPETAILAEGCACASIFGNDDASASTLDVLAAHGVQYLALRSAGYNHVDLHAATRLGIRVANVPAYSPYAVAEHTVALMLALNRKIVRAHSRVREMNFSVDGLTGFDMHGKTVAVIGTGRIGSVLCTILRGFGCTVLAVDPIHQASLEAIGVRYVDLDTACTAADIVSLLVPLMPSTRHIINARTIALMKRGVMLINTSRGGLVDTVAVIAALKTGHIGYLGLDVYEQEAGIFFHDKSDTILQDDVLARLMTFPNVLITSHQAFLTEEALRNIAATTMASVDAWQEGRSSETELNQVAR